MKPATQRQESPHINPDFERTIQTSLMNTTQPSISNPYPCLDARGGLCFEWSGGLQTSEIIGETTRSPHPLQTFRARKSFVTINSRLAEMERLIRRDPAQRGLIASEAARGPLCPGHLTAAARHLAEHGRRVLLVTGFFIPGASPPAAETDGPPGTALLAAALKQLGISIQIVTDEPCRTAVEVAAQEMGLAPEEVCSIPSRHEEQEHWFARLLATTSHQPPLTHLISLERVGPSHTSASIQTQLFGTIGSDWATQHDFDRLVPPSDQDHCHNMRGECIDAHTAPLHRLFELAASRDDIRTIGIGDGGNEIGMGSIPWHELHRRLNGPHAARVPCRIATDWTIVAGVSNWGGQALAAAVLALTNKTHAARDWTANQQLQLLERLVTDGPAVDGITRLREATVDGLPFLTYIQPWEGLRRLMGFTESGNQQELSHLYSPEA